MCECLQGQAAVGGVSLYMMKSHYQEFSKHGPKGLAEAIGEETHADLAQYADVSCLMSGTGLAVGSSLVVCQQ